MSVISKKEKAFNWIVNIIVLIILAIFVLPLLYIFFMSISSPEAVYFGRITFFPKGLSFKAYAEIFKRNDLLVGFGNTIFMVVVGTVLSLICTFGLAYPLSRRDFKGRRVITLLCVFTMFFSGGLIPLYVIVQKIGLYDNIMATILPCCVSVWNVIVVRTFISSTIPTDLEEAARIDGASDFRIYVQIILPLCKSVIAIMILFYGVGYWNSYFYPLVFISPSNDSGKTLQLIMQNILLNDGGGVGGGALEQKMLAETVKYSSIIVTTLPMLIVYPFLSKHLEKGLMIGGVKG